MSSPADGLALIAALVAGRPVDALRERAGAVEPVGLAEIHPSWLGEAVPAGAQGPVREYLVRARTAHLVDMPEGLPPAGVLEARLVELGVARLAASLALVPPLARAQVARGMGSHAEAVMAALARPVDPAAAAMAVRELAGLPRESLLLLRAAARHLGPALSPELGRQLAQRLPRPLGEAFLAETARGVVPQEVSQRALSAVVASGR